MQDLFYSSATGLGMGFALLAAIGPQNMFVFQQGVGRSYAKSVATVCFASHVILLFSAVGGLSAALAAAPVFLQAISSLGGALLALYGVRALRAAATPSSTSGSATRTATSWRPAIATALALSLLNPHVYIDTIVVLGGVASSFSPSGRYGFAIGNSVAAACWFYGLAIGGTTLSAVMQRSTPRRILDGFVGVTMLAVSFALIATAFNVEEIQ